MPSEPEFLPAIRARLLRVRGWIDVSMGGSIVLALAAFAALAAGMLYLGLYEDTCDWSGDDISLADMGLVAGFRRCGAGERERSSEDPGVPPRCDDFAIL